MSDVEAVIGMAVPADGTSAFEMAFTHVSAVRPDVHGSESYERLEYIGDAVLAFVVAKFLFDTFPGEDEGFLTRVRTKLVSGKFLSVLAWRMKLQGLIVMNQEAICKGWNANPKILEDVFEALVGAVYLTMGMVAARDFVLAMFSAHSDLSEVLIDTNHKDRLKRYMRGAGMSHATYLATESLDSKTFEVAVDVDGRVVSRARARSKKDAEQAAAKLALERFGVPDEIIQSARPSKKRHGWSSHP